MAIILGCDLGEALEDGSPHQCLMCFPNHRNGTDMEAPVVLPLPRGIGSGPCCHMKLTLAVVHELGFAGCGGHRADYLCLPRKRN